MDIKRSGSQPSRKGPAEYFTGTVRVDPLFETADPARVVGASVTFEPGARTTWHTHPLGQTLIVTAGSGLAQRSGGPIEPWSRPLHQIWRTQSVPPVARPVNRALHDALGLQVEFQLEHYAAVGLQLLR
jgi:hypothetical protein